MYVFLVRHTASVMHACGMYTLGWATPVRLDALTPDSMLFWCAGQDLASQLSRMTEVEAGLLFLDLGPDAVARKLQQLGPEQTANLFKSLGAPFVAATFKATGDDYTAALFQNLSPQFVGALLRSSGAEFGAGLFTGFGQDFLISMLHRTGGSCSMASLATENLLILHVWYWM
jgi:hypothetical protein